MTQQPTCAEARPSTCPCCGAASRPLAGRYVIVGHGKIKRELAGPMTAAGKPELVRVVMRRYRCRACRAILVVGPRGLVRRRSYGASAIANALASYAQGETSAAVRAATSPSHVIGVAARERWITLTRWIDAAREGDIFGVRGLGGLTRRAAAEQVVLVLAARAGWKLGEDRRPAAFAGAAIAA